MRFVPGVIVLTWLTLLTLLTCGCGGGGGSTGGATSNQQRMGSTQGSAPALVQWNTYQTQGSVGENDSTLPFKSMTTAGNTIWVVATLSDFAGVHTISVTDSQGNAFTRIDQLDNASPGTQSLAHFYAANIVGDTMTPDIVTVHWTFENYKGILLTEISGTTQAPLVGYAGHIQDGLGAGTDNVTAGPIAVTSAQTPALLLALSMNTTGGTSDTGGTGASGPAAGTGLTQVAMFWDWGANLATFATAAVTGPESVTALFSAPDTDHYITIAAVFH